MAGALLPARSTSAPSPAEENVLAQQADHCPGPGCRGVYLLSAFRIFHMNILVHISRVILYGRAGCLTTVPKTAVFPARAVMREGYTVLRGVMSAPEVVEARAMLDARIAGKLAVQLGELEGKSATGKEFAAAGRSIAIGGPTDSAMIGYPGMLASAPELAELLIKPFLLSPRLLDLAERVMGPFVQGDGFYVQGTPPTQLEPHVPSRLQLPRDLQTPRAEQRHVLIHAGRRYALLPHHLVWADTAVPWRRGRRAARRGAAGRSAAGFRRGRGYTCLAGDLPPAGARALVG
jgi:hypothetical protein